LKLLYQANIYAHKTLFIRLHTINENVGSYMHMAAWMKKDITIRRAFKN